MRLTAPAPASAPAPAPACGTGVLKTSKKHPRSEHFTEQARRQPPGEGGMAEAVTGQKNTVMTGHHKK